MKCYVFILNWEVDDDSRSVGPSASGLTHGRTLTTAPRSVAPFAGWPGFTTTTTDVQKQGAIPKQNPTVAVGTSQQILGANTMTVGQIPQQGAIGGQPVNQAAAQFQPAAPAVNISQQNIGATGMTFGQNTQQGAIAAQLVNQPPVQVTPQTAMGTRFISQSARYT